jgi:hypothetical protein
VVFAAICITLCIHLIKFNKKNSDIDELETLLTEIRNFTAGSSRIYFMDKLYDSELYYKTQYVLVPLVCLRAKTLSDIPKDSFGLLILKKHSNSAIEFDSLDSKILIQGECKTYKYVLFVQLR